MGQLRGIVPDCIQVYLDMLSEGTIAEGASDRSRISSRKSQMQGTAGLKARSRPAALNARTAAVLSWNFSLKRILYKKHGGRINTMEIKVLHQIMDWNEDVSQEVKDRLKENKICLINIMGSPGAGKTTLITSLIVALREQLRIGVIEGDIAGQVDAERIAQLGIPTVQLNTDGACHIEAMSIREIINDLPLDDLDIIFVENIGNLVCPAEFRIGETLRITLLSIPEGDDKVEKYPLMFTDTDCLVLNKYDMLTHFDFNEERVVSNYHTVNPDAPLFCVSSRSKEGISELAEFISQKISDSFDEK